MVSPWAGLRADLPPAPGNPLLPTEQNTAHSPGQARGKSGLRNMGPPDRKEPIALRVGVLKGGTFPLFPASSQPGLGGEQGQMTAGVNLATRYSGECG